MLQFLLSLLFSLAVTESPKPIADAEREYAQKSFRRAHELYQQAAKLDLSADDRRWVEMRLLDTLLRADAAAPDSDARERTKAREALIEFIRKSTHDLTWAEANEALGNYYALHPYERNPGAANPYYLAALDWWAGSSDLATARRRYLDIVWKIAGEDVRWDVPREILVNAVAIAETPEDRVRARYFLARRISMEGTEMSYERAFELFAQITSEGKRSEYYDDALFYYATLLAQRGQYAKALEINRRITTEFTASTSKYYEHAQSNIQQISAPTVGVQVAGTFAPESEQEVVLSWRNVKNVELTLVSVDLTKDIRYDESKAFFDQVEHDRRPVVRKWSYATNDAGEHIPGNERMSLEPRLPAGAYVLLARAGGAFGKALILVTDAHILVHSGSERTEIFVSDVVTGEPIANARVHVWQGTNGEKKFVERDLLTNANGLARYDDDQRNGRLFITAAAGARQAYHEAYHYWYTRYDEEPAWWTIYAFTDRPAYRPGESVQFKVLTRTRVRDEWHTPAGEMLHYDIRDPRGQSVATGNVKLNAFGAMWSDLALTSEMPLGVYTVNFSTNGNHRASAQLFRLEEYKLPEFLVKVSTPEGKQHRLGETIEATIDASYYFGGPVSNATVEVVVYAQPFYRYWYPWRDYAWYYDRQSWYDRPGGQLTKRETLQTDANGRAILTIETSPDTVEMNYRIEARVVDASRREVRGEGNVRVTKQRYAVYAFPEHHVHRPGDSVSIDFKAIDANEKPVQATGEVRVVRRRNKEAVRPSRLPGSMPGLPVQDEEVLTTKLTTNAEGESTLTFTPKTIGYYVVRWTSKEGPSARDTITSETAVWVTERATTELGYHPGGLNLIIDKDTMRSGETANVMIVAPNSGRWVLFSSSGDRIFDTQVLKLDGNVKLVQIPLTHRHTPNFFVTASSVFERQMLTDSEQIIVPPLEKFLEVEVKTDRDQYQPREEGTVTITTRDINGPVSAEVALSVSDESVTAIQADPAGDPRQFFHGHRRSNVVQVSGSLQRQRYLTLKEADEPQARDEEKNFRAAAMNVGGVVGGYSAEYGMPAPPPPPSAAPQAVTESITVAAEAPMAKRRQEGAASGMDVQVRTDFRSTAYWQPDIVTDKNGTATVKVKFPDALTTWRATARAASTTEQFGMSSATARTSMPLLVRLQGPRFFVTGDRVVISAVMNNNTNETLIVTPALEAEGLTLQTRSHAPVTIAPNTEARADWNVLAETMGTAKLRVSARTEKYGDAMEKSFDVYEHGIDKLIARSGKLRGDEALIRLDLPRERRATDLTVQVAPTLATAMLDALPYLVEYPYGCTEQTMSRFLPAVIVARTVEKLGLGRARLAGKDLDAVTKAGIARLYDMQHGDGGWGWWKEGSSDPFMTAYVVWGFAIARDAGLSVDTARIDRAAEWLTQNLIKKEGDFNDQAWMLHALSAWGRKPFSSVKPHFDDVWKNRERLSAYSRALLALAAHRWGEAEKARVLIDNLEDGVQIDKTPDQSVLLKGETSSETMQTAHWGARGFWWRWYDGPVETTAFALQALVTIDPKHPLIEPAMNWLVKGRRGKQWSNTRDTAIALLAMNDYLQRSGELTGDVAYEVSVNGRVIATKTLTAKEVLSAPSRFPVDAAVLKDTTQEIRIRRTGGKAPIYFSAEARFVSLEEPVKAAGNEIFVRREYFRLAPRPTLLKGVQYDRIPLRDGESVKSGERVEVVVTVDSKNDYSYLLFEDLKPAGFEAVELQSGQAMYATSPKGSVWVYQELRDRKVAMFIDHLPQGVWEMKYTLRAEVPGQFHGLPLLGEAMYVPDVRANGEEIRITVTE